MIPSSTSARRRRARGFTLVELMVVLLVAFVIAALAVPGARRMMMRSQLVGAASQIANAMQAARLRAIRSGQQTVVRLDPATKELKVFVDFIPDKMLDPSDVREKVLATMFLPRAVELNKPAGDILTHPEFETAGSYRLVVFQPQGMSEQAGAFRVAVQIPGLFENYLEVRIPPPLALGRVQIRKWEKLPADPAPPRTSPAPPDYWVTSGEGDKAWQWKRWEEAI